MTGRTPALLWSLGLLLALSLAANVGLLARRARPVEARASPAASLPKPTVADERVALPPELLSYAGLGTYLASANRIPDLDWTPEQFAAFAEGLRACYKGRPYPFTEDAKILRDAINRRVETMLASERPDPIEQYFASLREKENVERTPTNLHYRITLEGEGARPTEPDQVVVSYAARLPAGETLPSLARARVRVRVSDLLPGLREGVQLLAVGGKALVYVPPTLSFGTGAWPAEVPRGSPVIFFLELHEIVPADDW